jgi:hypothetical protein
MFRGSFYAHDGGNKIDKIFPDSPGIFLGQQRTKNNSNREFGNSLGRRQRDRDRAMETGRAHATSKKMPNVQHPMPNDEAARAGSSVNRNGGRV